MDNNSFTWKPISINIPETYSNNFMNSFDTTTGLIYDFLSSINPNKENKEDPIKSIIDNNSQQPVQYNQQENTNPISLFKALDKYEGAGGYDTLFNHAQNNRFKDVKVSEMSLGDLKKFSDPKNGEYGRYVADINKGIVATPMGRGQIVGTKLREMQSKMGLSDNTIFSPQLQNKMINTIAKERIAGKNNIDARKALINEWVGLKNMPTPALDAIIQNIRIGNSY